MKNKRKSEKYDPENVPFIKEDEFITTELSDEGDNELYIRYKMRRHIPDDTDRQVAEKREALMTDVALLKKAWQRPRGKGNF